MSNDETVDQQTERHKRNTFLVLCGLGGAGALWEIWTILNRCIGDTFSAILRMLGNGQPFIPFMFGMLNGHLWKGYARVACVVGFVIGIFFWPLKDGED